MLLQLYQADCIESCVKVVVVPSPKCWLWVGQWQSGGGLVRGSGHSAGHCFPSILHLMAHGQTRPEMADSDITHSHYSFKIYAKSFYWGSNLTL